MKKTLALALIFGTTVLTGCATKVGGLHLITEDEAKTADCQFINYVGSASAILINGKARNTSVIMKKAKKLPGATHISYTKGEPGYAFTRANVWHCPNPDLMSSDPETLKYEEKYFGE